MKKITDIAQKRERPIRILQFGEGNFLRAFVDYMVDIANEKEAFNGSVVIVKPISMGTLDVFKEQDCFYTVLLRGKQDGGPVTHKRLVTSVRDAVDAYSQYELYTELGKLPELKFIVSNTTEAGIVYDESDDISLKPPKSYPGKLTKLLYERYLAFNGAKDKGLIILPVELIERNGEKLLECCQKLAALWHLPKDFSAWLNEANTFCSTLVDRIVTGYPGDEISEIQRDLGYEDKLVVTGEPFGLWVIESNNPGLLEKEFPLDKAGLPVVFTDDQRPYRERKVRVLNGAHTSTVLAAYLSGLDTVGDLMGHKNMRGFMEKILYEDIVPYVPLPQEEVKAFAHSVTERFENPFIKHRLLDISLNSVSKFKARVLPSLKDAYEKTGAVPDSFCLSLAALACFYSGEKTEDGFLLGKRGEDTYKIKDDQSVLDFFSENRESENLAEALLGRKDFWGEDLNKLNGFTEKVSKYLSSIREGGVAKVVSDFMERGAL